MKKDMDINQLIKSITKEDIRELIKDGAIKAKKVKGVSKGRFRKRLKQKKKGLRRGVGSRKGKRKKRRVGKSVWVKRVRLLRKLLAENKAKLGKGKYQELRKEIKSSQIKIKKQLLERIGK